jgi:acyl-homoserine lactone acylase PvdQ
VRRSIALSATLTVSATVLLTAALTGPAAARPAAGPSTAYRANDYADGQIQSILPPGANGLVNATDLAAFELAGTRPADSADQAVKYNALSYGYKTLTDSTLGDYYDDESFGVPAGQITKTVTPEAGVTINYGANGVPHIYGSNDDTMSFGAGYAQASDRLFMMDVLRHYGAGTTSQFLGPSCADEQMDHDQLLLGAYTPAQAQAQVDALPTEYGAQGARTKAMIDSFVAGVNAYISAAITNPELLPADYGAAGINALPQPWTDADVVSVAGLVGGIFGKGGGIEVANSALYTYLTTKLGTAGGQAAFNEFKSDNDPDAPTTIVDKSFPYEQGSGLGSDVPTSLNVLPDVDPSTHEVTLTGGPTDTTTDCDLTKPSLPGLADISGLLTLPKQFSNALVVNASHSTGGHPLAVFGPQVSYFAPEILMEEDLHSPTYDAEGASFPGTGVVELGRGQDYAWSATSAGTDLIDQRVLTVCDPGGGAPTADEPDYLFDGKCTPMVAETFDDDGVTSPGATGAPAAITHVIYLTNDGIVQGWTTTDGGKKVIAIVNERSTYNHDIDSVIGFVAWGTPSLTYDATSWMHGAGEIEYTFNWFYVDDRDDAYYVSGLDPIRPTDLDPDLPASGTGNAEWQGYLPFADHPHEINPPQGFFVSWNNKPAPAFSAADDQFGYGESYRSQMLTNQLKVTLAANDGKITRAQLVQTMEYVSSQDLDGLTIIPQLLAYLKANPAPAGTSAADLATDDQMIALLTSWSAAGAHRHKAQESDTQYQDAAAIAISDELVPNLIDAVYNPLFAAGGTTGVLSTGGASTPGYTVVPMQFTNTPNSGGAHLGSAYDGGWEGYMEQTFQQLLGEKVGLPFTAPVTSTWCDGGPTSCDATIWKTLTDTGSTLANVNGTSTAVADWTQDSATAATAVPASPANLEMPTPAQTMPQFDAIEFRAVGIVGQTPLDWQNRPTFQQVVEFPAHRARTTTGATAATGTSGTATGTRGDATGELAFTGGLPGAALALGLVGAGGALTFARRRRSRRPRQQL